MIEIVPRDRMVPPLFVITRGIAAETVPSTWLGNVRDAGLKVIAGEAALTVTVTAGEVEAASVELPA